MQQGSDYKLDDLLGTWEMIEAETLAGNGTIVPNGVLVEYARHPEKQALMISTMTAPQRNPDFSASELVYLDQRLVHHLRSFKMETAGLPEDLLGVDFSVNLVALYMQDGRPIMLTRNTVSGLNYAFAKLGQAATAGAPMTQQGSTPATAQPSGGFGKRNPKPPGRPWQRHWDGVWQRHDGVILIVQGNQFQVNQYGMAVDTGMFATEANVLTTQSSYTGAQEQYQFALEGDVLQLRMPGEAVQLSADPVNPPRLPCDQVVLDHGVNNRFCLVYDFRIVPVILEAFFDLRFRGNRPHFLSAVGREQVCRQ